MFLKDSFFLMLIIEYIKILAAYIKTELEFNQVYKKEMNIQYNFCSVLNMESIYKHNIILIK